jgi:hypothetical protein
MDDLETMRVLDPRNELLEKASRLMFGHAAICDDEVEKLAACIFEDNDDIGRC